MKILNVMTEHTAPFKILIEVLKEILQETNIEFRSDIETKPENKEESENKENNTKSIKSNKTTKKNTKSAPVKKSAKYLSDDDELIDSDEEPPVKVTKPVKNTKKSKNTKNTKAKHVEPEPEEVENEIENGMTEIEDNEQKAREEEQRILDKSCMRIMAVDLTKTVLIHLKLEGKNFTKFECKGKKITLGVNLGYFYKLIKSMDKDDSLTLYVEHDDKNYLRIKIDNPEEKKNTTFKLKLLDLRHDPISVPDITFDAVIIINSTEFHKICREMNQIADYVEIKCLKDKIIFTCKGDYAERTTVYSTDDGEEGDGITIKLANNEKAKDLIIQGIYELRNLVLFSKCAQLCNDIEIYMKNNYPLVIKYTAATLGKILLCLTPINEDPSKTAEFSDEDDLYDDDEVSVIV